MDGDRAEAPEPTRTGQAAAVAVGVLGVLELVLAATAADSAVVVTSAFLGVLTVLAGVALAREPAFEWRLGAVILVVAQLVTVALATTVGLPGHPAQEVDGLTGACVAASFCVLALLTVDHRLRRRRSDRHGFSPPYAL